MRFRLLGLVRAEVGDRPISLGSRGQRFVAAVLALEVNTLVSTDRLVDVLWPFEPPARARGIVRNHISGIRAILRNVGSGVRVDRGGSGYLLSADPDLIDVHRFRVLLARAQDRGDDRQRVAWLDEALGLWAGPALSGVTDEQTRARMCRDLDEARLTAVEDRADARLRLGQARNMIDELLAINTEYPYRPRAVGALMLALHQQGRSAEALEVYGRTARALRDELGLDAPVDLRDLHLGILRGETDLIAQPAPAPAPVPAPATSGVPVPRQLPADTAQFTGRIAELDLLHRLLAPGGGAAMITAIDGMAGVGKTTLAIHAAHRLVDRCPDGQLFLDLHGHADGLEPVAPDVAADALLRSLGVPGQQVPPSLDARAALLRTRLAGKRVLMVLDNAADEEQVIPLLPGTPGCLVLITSRRRLAGLDQAEPVSLDVLPLAHAVDLFASACGSTTSRSTDPAATEQVVELCGRLPLAIRIAATRLRHRPGWTVTHLLEKLRGEHGPLAALHVGRRSVTAALNLSYRDLTPDQRRLFRALGLHPGADIDAYAAAALVDTSLDDASRTLEELLDAHLLTESSPGRYTFHDLIRHHASALAQQDTGVDRRDALARLIDYYAYTATVAMDAVYPYEADQRPHRPKPHTPIPGILDGATAEAWIDTETNNLLAPATHSNGLREYTLHMSATLHRHLRTRGRYADAGTLHHHALSAARDTGNRTGELHALCCLGAIHRMRGEYERAADCFDRSLAIARDTGNRGGELNALWGLGSVHRMRGRLEEAMSCYGEAHTIARAISNRTGELDALWGLGDVHRVQSRYLEAIDCFDQVLVIARDIGNRGGELNALWGLGDIQMVQGRHEQAADSFGQVLVIARDVGSRNGELNALWGLGDLRRTQGKYELAVECFNQMLAIAQDIGNRGGELNALHGVGDIHRVRGRYEEATDCYGQANAIARDTGNRGGEVNTLIGLGNIHLAQGRCDQSADCFGQVLEISRHLDSLDGQFEGRTGLARVHHATGDYQQALIHHHAALDLATALNQPAESARGHKYIADTYHALGRHDLARDHWLSALETLIEHGIDHTYDHHVTTTTLQTHLTELGDIGDTCDQSGTVDLSA